MSCRVLFFSAMTVALIAQFPALAADKQSAAKATQQLSQPAAKSAAQPAPAKKQFSQAELDQMLAPVALYPDTVLSHVLIAATYPLEIIKATRWLSAKPGMTSEQALKAAENESWDPSVRALVAFPPLLTKMNNELEWTQKLGDAFLIQEKQVMATVQRLREKAYTAGNLNNQEHIRVERKEKVIVIEPARPEVIYVPVYDTRVVYGDWWWRSYPPIHWPYPTGYRRHSSFYWGAGVQVAPSFYFSTFYWPRSEIVVIHHHHYRPSRYYRSHDIVVHEERRHWRHNPQHRHGVVYQAGYEPPVRETRGETWRYEDQDERRRWAAEKRQDNNVAMPGDQQIIDQPDPDRDNLRRQQQEREQVFAQPVNELDPQTGPITVTPDQGDTQTPIQPVAETIGGKTDVIEQPVFEQPVHENPVTDMPAPVDQVISPEPVQPLPEPVYQQPEPVYQQPEPVYQQPEPVYQQPEPVYQQPEPVYQQPEPVYQQPEPVFQQPEPVFQQPEPVFQQPEPVSQPVIDQSGIQ